MYNLQRNAFFPVSVVHTTVLFSRSLELLQPNVFASPFVYFKRKFY